MSRTFQLVRGLAVGLASTRTVKVFQRRGFLAAWLDRPSEEIEEMPPVTPEELPSARVAAILKPENWSTPKWYVEKNTRKIQTYEDYLTFQLRARYIELENDFRSVLGNFPKSADIVTAGRISEILHSARDNLEQETAELLTLASSLDLAERYMVWLCPPWVTKARISGILPRLDVVPIEHRDALVKRLTDLSKAEEEEYPGQFRSVLDDTIGTINSQIIQDRISMGLQVSRLKTLRFWGLITLSIFFALSPFATNLSKVHGWPSQSIAELLQLRWGLSFLFPWLNALAMMALGAVGGFLSGLLQAQSTSVTFTKYLEDMLKLELRPIVGALVALILYALLSWQVLPGITIENAGSYFLIAFLSGFSERYFLQLLRTDSQEQAGPHAK